METKPYPHVLIIGAGMSGLTLAQQLKKNNISFSIFERELTPTSRNQGWALSLFGQALHNLETLMPEELGPVDQTSHLRPLDLEAQFSFYDITKPGVRVAVASDDTGKIVRAHRQRLRDWLIQGIDVQFGKRLVEVEETAAGVTASFEDGSKATGHIMIGAEGSRSMVRKHLLKGQDIIEPLPLGSLVGEVALSGADFAKQLSLSHSGYIVMDPTLKSEDQISVFAALNKVSDDGKTGYYYYLLLWVDPDAGEKQPWTASASKEDLHAFAREQTAGYPPALRALVEKVPVEGYSNTGFQLQGVQVEAGMLPACKVMIIGDAAHSMTPFRGEGGHCAFMDAFNMAKLLIRVRDEQIRGPEFEKLSAEFIDEMVVRSQWASKVSNSVLADYGRYENYKFGTFGKDAVFTPPETITV